MVLRILISLALLYVWIDVADSFCMMSRPVSQDPENCVYKNRVFSLGSTYTDYDDCMRYSCSSDGSMSICGIGIHAGVFQPPLGCQVIKGEKCAVKLVDMLDPEVDCQPYNIG